MARGKYGLRVGVAALAIGASVATTHCGSRSGVPGAAARDAGGSDAAADPCAPPELHVACAAAIANPPAGSQVWSASFDLVDEHANR